MPALQNPPASEGHAPHDGLHGDLHERESSSHIVGSDKLNLADWIEEELILSLPLVPAHEEGCQTDGPEESKDEVQKPNPFAKLKDLKGLRKV